MTVTPSDYERVRELLHRDSGNRLDDGKEYLVNARLGPVAERNGFPSIGALLAAVRAGKPGLRTQVVEAMTINETSFFRDNHPYQALVTEVIPQLLTPTPRELNLWSAAASTGQEAYSLAILMRENFPLAPAPRILGTDLADGVLERAKAGVYTQLEVNRGLPARSLVRYFAQEGRSWAINPDLRAMVQWRQMNLCAPWPGLPAMDLIMMRNVLIYFDDATRRRVLERAVAALRPGGYLFLGGAETIMLQSDRVERITIGRTVCFRASE